MSLRNTDGVDIVIKDPSGKGYRLIATDDGEIQDPIERYNLMIDKLIGYVNYVYSGKFFKDTPQAKGQKIIINVICVTEPNAAMLNVTAVAAKQNPKFRLDVEVSTQDAFMDSLPQAKDKKSSKKAWWHFWASIL